MSVPERYMERIISDLQFCENCQPRDNEEEEGFIWAYGKRIQFREYLNNIGVPEKYHKEIDSSIWCPHCGSQIGLYIDIGIESDYEKEYNKKYKNIVRNISPLIEEFAFYLGKYPYLGAKHPIGKKICKEINELHRESIQSEVWYRGRRVNDGRIYGRTDMLPPNPEKVIIGEGRFNHYGQSHYYLGSSEGLCLKELYRNLDSICWIQEINIISAENIIDLSGYIRAENIDEIPIVFCGIMTSGIVSRSVLQDNSWKPEYFVPRFIADVCKEYGVNGIRYESSLMLGWNLVLFDITKIKLRFVGKPKLYHSANIDSLLFNKKIGKRMYSSEIYKV